MAGQPPGAREHGALLSRHRDATFLRRALKPLRSRILRSLFHAPSGPFLAGLLRTARDQQIAPPLPPLPQGGGDRSIPADDEQGQYPIGSARWDDLGEVKDRGIRVAIDNPTGAAFTLQLRVGRVGGGLHLVGVRLFDPNGQELLGGVGVLAPEVTDFRETDGVLRSRPSGWDEYFREVSIPAHRASAGRYDLAIP